MKKNKTLFANLTQGELLWGWVYLFFETLLLPSLLSLLNQFLPQPMSSAELNFTYFGINFLAVLWIFHSF